MIARECPVVFETHGPGHHFFGYYDKSPFDRGETRLLSHRADHDWKRLALADDVIAIGYWNLADGQYHEIAKTRAYNWQQGSHLQWLGPDYDSHIIFNDREDDHFVSRVVNVADGSVRTLPLPIYSLSPTGKTAICCNYERFYFSRPGYNYQGVVKPEWDRPLHPDDGLWRMDLETGENERIVSTQDMTRFHPSSSMAGAIHYLEHVQFNPNGSRFAFFHCWRLPDGGIYSRLLSADKAGNDVRVMLDTGMISHTGWRDVEELSAWGRPASQLASIRRSRMGSQFFFKPLLPVYHFIKDRLSLVRGALAGDTYLMINDNTGAARALAPSIQFPDNGHCTWRPGDARWMLTDSYQDENSDRSLFLYDHQEEELIEIGRFHSVPETCNTGFRCDLHPRWGFSGNQVCIDSTHQNGERQMYVIDVTGVCGAR